MNMITRHWDMVRVALDEEKKRARDMVRTEEVSFLPAALEIVERPVSPTARATAWLLLVGLVVALLWLVFGRIDIVASAPGRLIPAENVKLVQPAEAGIVRSILVREGQAVRKGQLLVELDPTMSSAETAQAESAFQTALFDAVRARAVLSALDGKGLAFVAPEGTLPALVATQRALAASEYANIDATTSGRGFNVSAARAARAEALVQAQKLTETIPLIDEQLQAYEDLLSRGYAAKLKVIEMRRQRAAAVRDRDAALETAKRAEAQASGASSGVVQTRAEARTRILGDLAKAEADVALRREELVKSRQRSALQRLTASVDGTIAQLSIHTLGGVVEAGKPIMTVVPRGGDLVAEVKLLNRDAGFVRAGQEAAVKLEAFPFTRYGTVPGKVLWVATDAAEDEKLGLVYTARIAVERPARGTSDIVTSPGMAATADIRTGRRSLLSYLLSPIDQVRHDAGRER